eukprot:TRINITY_DN9368_c0_g1_i1.p1 TRINITY_DN9368_c0_g1~~TRINITY_DN9368_c0_g1_i1.p1  ORF type:complete len:139 (-),score=38.30 TRINITY_DN9368_c0_g1_i1:60-476(-)
MAHKAAICALAFLPVAAADAQLNVAIMVGIAVGITLLGMLGIGFAHYHLNRRDRHVEHTCGNSIAWLVATLFTLPIGIGLIGVALALGSCSCTDCGDNTSGTCDETLWGLSLIHISEPTRLLSISYAVFCLKKKKKNN